MQDQIVEKILAFWFQDISTTDEVPFEKMAHWWTKNAVFDKEIKDTFEPTLASAAHDCQSWLNQADSRLALIILLDQFPRNIYRGQAQAFAYDALALQTAIQGVALQHDKALPAIQRAFFYLPFEHAEDHDMQERSVALFADLLKDSPPAQRAIFENFLDFAKQHKDIISQFGRYPHRNAVLNRVSTAEETQFLSTHDGF